MCRDAHTGESLLHYACLNRSNNIAFLIEFLLSNGVDPNIKSWYANVLDLAYVPGGRSTHARYDCMASVSSTNAYCWNFLSAQGIMRLVEAANIEPLNQWWEIEKSNYTDDALRQHEEIRTQLRESLLQSGVAITQDQPTDDFMAVWEFAEQQPTVLPADG